jgi:chromosome segregation ATPase
MSPSPNNPPPSPDMAQLQRELAEKTDLVQSVRKELILSQITVLELQDTVLQKETDKADAVAILGQAELVLEGKINYIFELDRVLNERIAEVQRELSAARSAHETITTDLVQKLDQANRDLGAAHTLAGNFAREASQMREKLTVALNSLQQVTIERSDTEAKFSAARAEMEALRNQFNANTAAKLALEKDLAAIHRSFAWKITAPFSVTQKLTWGGQAGCEAQPDHR